VIEKEVTQFIREECGKLPQLSRMMNADLKAIATDASTKDILKVSTFNDRMSIGMKANILAGRL
jgi:hypothetical protein